MLFRLSAAVLAVSVLACAGPPRPATETAAPAIQHFFGAREEKPLPEKSGEAAPIPEAAPEAPLAPEAPPAPEAPRAEPVPQPAEVAPRQTPDAVQHFFGESEAAVPEPRDAKGSEQVDAFEHFFGEEEASADEKPPV